MDKSTAIARRIASRRKAEEVALLLIDEAADAPDQKAFWERIDELIAEVREPAPKPVEQDQPMDDAAAKEYGARCFLAFGQYKGVAFKDVPLSYLETLVSDNAWKRQVRRYLRSPAIQRELELEQEDNCDGDV